MIIPKDSIKVTIIYPNLTDEKKKFLPLSCSNLSSVKLLYFSFIVICLICFPLDCRLAEDRDHSCVTPHVSTVFSREPST